MYLRPATENLQNKLYRESQTERVPSAGSDETTSSSETDHEEDDDDMNITNIIRYISEICTLIGVLSYVVFQQGDEIKNQGFSAFTKQLVKKIFLLLIKQQQHKDH